MTLGLAEVSNDHAGITSKFLTILKSKVSLAAVLLWRLDHY